MILHRFLNGDTLERTGSALIARFAGTRRVLSTSAFNGGIKTDLEAVFNQDCKIGGKKDVPLKAPTYAGHMAAVARELGLDPGRSCGLSTAADMKNVSIKEETYRDLTVTAAVTGGIDENGGRAGDTAFWHESDGVSVPAPGTINILLFIDADLPDGTLTRALVTATEAKTAALQELLAPSLYSSGLATGSGTDGVIIVSNTMSPLRLTFAGKHAKLGELIGRTVKSAVREALFLQTGLCPERQFNIFRRLERFGITERSVLEKYSAASDENVRQKLAGLETDSSLVVYASLYAHLMDQVVWGLLDASCALSAAEGLLEKMGMEVSPARRGSAPPSVETLILLYTDGLVGLLGK